jgi:hypothetical protein
MLKDMYHRILKHCEGEMPICPVCAERKSVLLVEKSFKSNSYLCKNHDSPISFMKKNITGRVIEVGEFAVAMSILLDDESEKTVNLDL